MADVGGEAGLALDPGLHGVGHLVERARQPVEIGIGLRRQPRVEPARGDVLGRIGHLAEWPEQPSAGRQAEQGRQQQGSCGAERQRREDRSQRPFGRSERERLEVPGVVLGDGHADRDELVAVDRRELDCRPTGPHRVDQAAGEVGERVRQIGADLVLLGGSEHGKTVRLGAQVVLDEVADLDGIVRHHVTDVVGVLECLGLGGRGALVDQVVPREAVGDADQHDPRQQRDEREEERDAGAQPEGSTHRHGRQCGRRSWIRHSTAPTFQGTMRRSQ